MWHQICVNMLITVKVVPIIQISWRYDFLKVASIRCQKNIDRRRKINYIRAKYVVEVSIFHLRPVVAVCTAGWLSLKNSEPHYWPIERGWLWFLFTDARENPLFSLCYKSYIVVQYNKLMVCWSRVMSANKWVIVSSLGQWLTYCTRNPCSYNKQAIVLETRL